MALNRPPLPRPEYLIGVTTENAANNNTNGALNIFESGRLSKAPCSLCIKHNADCIVASTVAGKCMRCRYKSRHISECMAEGVMVQTGTIPDPTLSHNTSQRGTTQASENAPHPSLPHHNVLRQDTAKASKTIPDPTQPRHGVPRPEYLQGVTIENYGDFPTKCALHIFEHGKLSPKPCRRCVEANAVCMVVNNRSRCMRCSYIDAKTVECLAGGTTKIDISHFETSPETGYPIVLSAPDETNTSKCNPTTAPHNSQAAPQTAITFTSKPIASSATNPQDQTDHHVPTTNKKRKRRAADPLDASGLPANRPRQFINVTLTKQPLAPAAPRATGNPPPLVFEHPYAPTAPRPTGDDIAPTVPKTTNNTADPTSVGNAMAHNPTIRYAPPKSLVYDLDIRKTDPAKWAQWASDLHKELHNLRYVQDLGPYTHGVIAMMKADGVWPKVDTVGE